MLYKILEKESSEIMIDSVMYTFTRYSKNWFQIERVYIVPKLRKRGLLTKSLKKLIEFADKNSLHLTSNFLPDNSSDYEALRCAFSKNGFLPLEEDGEIYRNDVSRKPMKSTERLKEGNIDRSFNSPMQDWAETSEDL